MQGCKSRSMRRCAALCLKSMERRWTWRLSAKHHQRKENTEYRILNIECRRAEIFLRSFYIQYSVSIFYICFWLVDVRPVEQPMELVHQPVQIFLLFFGQNPQH